MTRLYSTQEEMSEYYEQRAIEDAAEAQRVAEAEAAEQAESEMIAQNILAGTLGLSLEAARHNYGWDINTHDAQHRVYADTRLDEYDLGIPYNGPGMSSSSTFIQLDRTFRETRDGEVTENIPAEGRVDGMTVFAPDDHDDWRLPVMYGLHGERVATFTIDHEAGTISAKLPGKKSVVVSSNPLAIEAIQEMAQGLAQTPQRVITDTSEPPRARAI